MLRSSFCNCSDAYILFKGTITVTNTTAAGAAANKLNKKIMFKTALFTSYISRINNTQVDDIHFIANVVMQ